MNAPGLAINGLAGVHLAHALFGAGHSGDAFGFAAHTASPQAGEMALKHASLLAFTLLLVTPCTGHAEDLTLPPDIRHPQQTESATQPAQPASSKSSKPKSAKAKAQKPTETAAKQPAQTPAVAKSSAVPDENRFGLDMKWNADNSPATGGPNTSGLFTDYNRNVNGETVGSGAAVGMHYKF